MRNHAESEEMQNLIGFILIDHLNSAQYIIKLKAC